CDDDRRRRSARPSRGRRRRDAGCVRLELLPRAGAVDALPDARVGRVRRGRRAARAAPSAATRAGGRRVRARLRLQHVHGRLGVVRLLAARRAVAHPRRRPRDPVQPCARDRQRRHCARGRARATPPARTVRPPDACGGRVGLKLLATLAGAVALATTPASYLRAQQQPDGGWGSPQLTAWSVLGLRAAGADTGGALDYLVAHESELAKPTEIALIASAEAALGHDPGALLARFPAKPAAVNDAIWQIFALRQSRRAVPATIVSYVKASQARSGGFPWTRGTAPDSNTAAWAVQALRAT